MYENSCKYLLDQSTYLSCFFACVQGVKRVPKTHSLLSASSLVTQPLLPLISLDRSVLAPQWKQDMTPICIGCHNDTGHHRVNKGSDSYRLSHDVYWNSIK